MYFVTICTREKQCHFGNIEEGVMRLSKCGIEVEEWWQNIPHHFLNVTLDQYIIMPNHLHGIIAIGLDLKRRGGVPPPAVPAEHQRPTLSSIIGYFKYQSTKAINVIFKRTDGRGNPAPTNDNLPPQLWQRGYYEHVVRNEIDLNRIREYIQTNPMKWAEDKYWINSA